MIHKHPFPHPSYFGINAGGHCLFQNNKEVEMAHHEWLQMQEIYHYNSCQVGKNASVISQVTRESQMQTLEVR